MARLGVLSIEHLQPTLAALGFHLGETLGFARCRHWAAPLGLKAGSLLATMKRHSRHHILPEHIPDVTSSEGSCCPPSLC